MTENTTKTAERQVARLRRVQDNAAPTPSVQVMARDAADSIDALIEALAQANARVEELEQAEAEKKPATKRQTRKTRGGKAQEPADAEESGGDEADGTPEEEGADG